MQQSSHLLSSRTLKIHVGFFVAKTFKELKQGLPEMQRERKTHQDAKHVGKNLKDRLLRLL